MKYRPEIDGLRAFALVPVIFYHAGFELFGGGFVGVDIFFVISGYLIARIILSELNAGTFSLLYFYERRARRILPAFFLVIFTCLPFAWFWLSPSSIRSFSGSLIASTIFLSNIFFYKTSGYFDASNETKPLIHTWSLSLEEQYYAFFPIFLLLSWRFSRRWALGFLIFVFVISLFGAQLLAVSHPSFTFYMLPTRVWELLIGVFVAFYFSRCGIEELNCRFGFFACAVGIFAIVYSVIFYSDRTPYPSIYTLVPTLGAALILIFATHETLVGRVLGSKILVGIGLISYSAYLWHQPIFALSRERSLENPSDNFKMALVGTTFLFAFLSWKYIEKPFRCKNFIGRKQLLVFSLMCSILFIVVGLLGYLNHGLTIGRYTLKQKEFISYFENSTPNWSYFTRMDFQKKYRSKCDFYDISKFKSGNSSKKPLDSIATECYQKNSSSSKTILIWGDSHAQQLYPGLQKYLSNKWQILQITSSGCPAELNKIKSDIDYCQHSNWFAYKVILETKPDVVLIGQNSGHDIKAMEKIAEDLKSRGIKKVIFTGPTPHWKNDLPMIIVEKLWENTPRRSYLGIDQNILSLDKKLKLEISNRGNAVYISIIDNLCNSEGCLLYIGDDKMLGITSWDYGHLTPIASEQFSRDILVPFLEPSLR
jgi:peptidoglycan/LPS O-acetylase OafA/YrhL